VRSRKNEYSALDAAIEAAKRFWAEILCITRVKFTLVMHADDTGNFYQRYLRKKVLILLLII